MKTFLETFWIFLRLGLTSFGGPVAHLGYFREEFVVRRQWLTEEDFVDLVALSQFLPGPSSSQVNLAIGLHRGGGWGALAAWLGFTLPSAILMILFAYSLGGSSNDLTHAGWLQGLKLAALAVVAQAVWSMAGRFCSERLTGTIGILAAVTVLSWSATYNQVVVILIGGLAVALFNRQPTLQTTTVPRSLTISYGRRLGGLLLTIFFLLLFGLPLACSIWPTPALLSFSGFYRVGSLVFGGGHVVLPLLQKIVVHSGWMDENRFLAGYGAAQALPGPLFTFVAFLGTVLHALPHRWLGGIWCLIAIYVPANLLMLGALPFWQSLRQYSAAQAALKGANAAVVGLLLATFYHPLWTSTILGPPQFLLALADLGLLLSGKCPPWLIVGLSALVGQIWLH